MLCFASVSPALVERERRERGGEGSRGVAGAVSRAMDAIDLSKLRVSERYGSNTTHMCVFWRTEWNFVRYSILLVALDQLAVLQVVEFRLEVDLSRPWRAHQ